MVWPASNILQPSGMYSNRMRKKELSLEISYLNSFLNLTGLCKFFQLGSLVGGFLYFNVDILKKSAKKF